MERIRLQKVALTVVDKFAHVKADEEALILSDTSIDQSLPEAMWGAADALGAKSHMLIMSSGRILETASKDRPTSLLRVGCSHSACRTL